MGLNHGCREIRNAAVWDQSPVIAVGQAQRCSNLQKAAQVLTEQRYPRGSALTLSPFDLHPHLDCVPSCFQHTNICSHPNSGAIPVSKIKSAFDDFSLTGITTQRVLT